MARWDFNLSIYNDTDRDFKVEQKNYVWESGHKDGDNLISKKSTWKLNCWASSGCAHGYEFDLVLRDVAPDGGTSYGTVEVHVDVPLTRDNSSYLNTTGLVQVSGWDGVLPTSGHDFTKSFSINKQKI